MQVYYLKLTAPCVTLSKSTYAANSLAFRAVPFQTGAIHSQHLFKESEEKRRGRRPLTSGNLIRLRDRVVVDRNLIQSISTSFRHCSSSLKVFYYLP